VVTIFRRGEVINVYKKVILISDEDGVH